MSVKGLGVLVSDVDATERVPLGTVFEDTDANNVPRKWRYVKAGEELAAGSVVMVKDASTTFDGMLATANVAASRVLGVAQVLIASGSYGFVQFQGYAEVEADDLTIDVDLAVVTSPGTTKTGTACVFAAGKEHQVIGHASENAADDAQATVLLTLPG